MRQIYNGAQSISTQNLNPNAGVPTANSVASLDMRIDGGADTAAVQVTGTYTGVLTPQVSNDGQNWVTMGGTPLINVGGGSNQANITTGQTGMFQVDVAAYRYFRMSANGAVTGAAIVSISAADANGVVGLDSPLPAGTANIGSVNANQVASANPGTTPVAVNSAATTNAASAKASAGVVTAISVMNPSAAIKYVRFYNKASAPTVGTDIPISVIAVPAGGSKEIEYGAFGKRFSTGIAYAITGGAAANDATAVAAGDVQLSFDYA